jgi:hypothetical protein
VIETRPLPSLAKTAFDLLMREFDARANALSTQTVEVLGLREEDDWTVDFNTGVMHREIPDAPPEAPVGG